MSHTTPSRRGVLAGSAVATLGAGALAGCGSGDSATTSGETGGGGTVSLKEIPVGGAVVQEVGGRPVVLTQPTAGTVVAFSGTCTHQGCAVVASGTTLSCPCHGSVFEAATGAVEQGPAAAPLPSVNVSVSGDTVTIG